jgi:hypothetical protein
LGKPKSDDEQELFYVLRRPDGSVRAELVMPPSTAEKINAGRRKRGFTDGEWRPEEPKNAVLWNLDFGRMPDWVFALLKKAQENDQECSTSSN